MRNRSLALLSIAAAVLVIVGLLLVIDRASGPQVAAAPDGVVDPPAVSEPPPAPSVAHEPEAKPVAAARGEVVPVQTEPTAREPELERGQVRVHGTIVAIDQDGEQHPSEDGSLELVLWRGTGGSNETVDVEAGRWSADVDADVRLGVDSAWLGGRRAVLAVRDQKFELPADGVIELRVLWPPVTLLLVRDEQTHLDLPDVTVVLVNDWFLARAGHPGLASPDDVLVEGRDSPVDLLPVRDRMQQQQVTLYVHSPGYAWGRLELDPFQGGERQVLLHLGGALRVFLAGAPTDPPEIEDPPAPGALSWTRPAHRRLRLRRDEGGQPFLDLAVDGRDEILVEDLPAGDFDVSVELGEWWREPNVLGRVAAVVEPGQLSEVTLTLEPPEDVQRVPFRGTLVIPPEWELSYFSLAVELLDAPIAGQVPRTSYRSHEVKAIDRRLGHFAWDAGLVQPGQYELDLHPLNYHAFVTVGEAGAPDTWFEIPPPARVSVRVVEQATGEPADLDRILWNPKWPEGSDGGGLESVDLDPATGRFAFRATQGPIFVRTMGNVYEHTQTEVEVEPTGTTEVLLALRPTCGILILLRDGETPVPWGQDWSVQAIGEDGEPVRAWGGHGDGHLLRLDHPGTYRLTFQSAEGFLPVPARDVYVDSRRVVEHVVELTRVP